MTGAPVLKFTDRGIYCADGDFYIDPWKPVERAVITHAHADHARPGHGSYLCSVGTAPALRHRLGNIRTDAEEFGTKRNMGAATVSLHPAGHVPGSAQIRVEVGGQVWVVSGDYKLEDDGLSTPFEPVSCHAFISECTFGLPVFRWPDAATLRTQLNDWWAQNVAEGRVSLLGAYSLGKAQRLLGMLDQDLGPVFAHGAIADTNDVLRSQGLPIPETRRISPGTDKAALRGAMVLAPPSALDSAWSRKLGPSSTAFASGWMAVRGIRRRRSADRGFVISDHADWDGLNQAIDATGAERIYVTHGYTTSFRHWLEDKGYDARIVETEFAGELFESTDSDIEDGGDATVPQSKDAKQK